MSLVQDDADPIHPVQIEHHVDEIWFGEELGQRYNYMDYHFERNGVYIRARTYLEDISSVSVDGPFIHRDSDEKVHAPEFLQDVLAYLDRRFETVEQD